MPIANSDRSRLWPNVLAAVIIALAFVASAQDASDEPDAPLPEYRVELIVFEYLSASGADEDWSADPRRDLMPYELPGTTSDDDVVEDTAKPVTTPRTTLSFSPANDGDMLLAEAYNKMRLSRDFRPMVHTAWRQPGYPRDAKAPRLDLRRVARLPGRLRGTVALSLARYLHLDIELDLDARSAAAAAGGPLGQRAEYQLRESRRMRSRQLHFIDHPRFGVLVRIDPVEVPETQDPETG